MSDGASFRVSAPESNEFLVRHNCESHELLAERFGVCFFIVSITLPGLRYEMHCEIEGGEIVRFGAELERLYGQLDGEALVGFSGDGGFKTRVSVSRRGIVQWSNIVGQGEFLGWVLRFDISHDQTELQQTLKGVRKMVKEIKDRGYRR